MLHKSLTLLFSLLARAVFGQTTNVYISETLSPGQQLTMVIYASGGGDGSPDVITYDTSADHASSTFTSPTFVGQGSSDFTYYGEPTNIPSWESAVYADGISSAPELDKAPPVNVWFNFTGTNFEIELFPYSIGTYAYNPPYFEIMEGTNETFYTNAPPFVENNNNPFFVPVYLSQAGTHHLKLAVHGGFVGIDYTNGVLSAWTPALKPNAWLDCGDSYTEGYNPTVTVDGYGSYWFSGYVRDVGRLETNNVVIPCAISGRGFYCTNTSTSPYGLPYTYTMTNDVWGTYSNLVASGLYNHIFISFNGSLNDGVQVDDNPSITNTIFSIATNCVLQTKAHCPLATVFMIGNWMIAGGEMSPSAPDYELEWAMTNAAAVSGVTIFDPIPANLKNSSNYYTDWYPPGSGTDNTHPAAAGYWDLANWIETNMVNTFGTNWHQ